MEPVVSRFFNHPDAWKLETALKLGAYEVAKKALAGKPEDVAKAVNDAGLRGCGGAGFPTARKWSFLPKDTKKPIYLVINADEGEPGTC